MFLFFSFRFPFPKAMFGSWLPGSLAVKCAFYTDEQSGSPAQHTFWAKDRKRTLQAGLVEILHIPQIN